MARILDLTGQRFGRLTVVELSHKVQTPTGKRFYWQCVCDCGNETTVTVGSLRGGNTKSCGCYKLEQLAARSTKHGYAQRKNKKPGYRSWLGMKQRCYNINNPKFDRYGARGITICAEWLDSFEQFIADMGPPPKGYTIDRIDNDGNYCPENCHWADIRTQAGNRSNNTIIDTPAGQMTIAEAARYYNIPAKIISDRRRRGTPQSLWLFAGNLKRGRNSPS